MTEMTTFFAGSGIRIALTALVILSAVVILLLIRSIRNWNKRTDDMIHTMKSMDDRMDGIETGLVYLKVSAEKIDTRLEEARAKMAVLEEKARMLPEFRQASPADAKTPLLPEEELPPKPEDIGPGEAASLLKQTKELEQEVEALKREKQRLKDEINARIRD